MDIIAITVSVNYDDILKHIITQNAQFFKEWLIVTSPDDTATKTVIKDSCLSNVDIIYFDKFKHNAVFNKGGAIRIAQDHVYKKYKKNANKTSILILDSDIFLPCNLIDVINSVNLENDAIYGVGERYDYHTLEDFLKRQNGNKYACGYDIVGFFQLYKFNSRYKYNNSNDCGGVDNDFRELFPNKRHLKLSVLHLGKDGINWHGRDKNKDNIWAKCKSSNCNYLMNTDIKRGLGSYCCYMCKNGKLAHGVWCQKKN